MWKLVNSQQSQIPAYQAILNGGIAFLRANSEGIALRVRLELKRGW